MLPNLWLLARCDKNPSFRSTAATKTPQPAPRLLSASWPLLSLSHSSTLLNYSHSFSLMQRSDLTLGCCTVEAAHLQPPFPTGWDSTALFLPRKDTVCFSGSKVLGNTLGKGCSAFEFWSRVCHKNDSMGLRKGLLESSQNN